MVIGHFVWAIVLEILDEIESTGHSVYLFNKDGIAIATPTIKRDRILRHSLTKYDLAKKTLLGESASSYIERVRVQISKDRQLEKRVIKLRLLTLIMSQR